jgi:hypothetical protein
LAAAAVLLIGFTIELTYYYRFVGLLALHPRVIWALQGLCVLMAAAVLWGGARVHRALLYGIWLFLAVEGALQGLAVLGWLPDIGAYDFAPYSRVYTRTGNSITNRYGWYAPRFALRPGAKKIAIIGDSYIQALDIQPQENLGAVLERRLNAGAGVQTEILPLGISGTCPAYYLELLRYARTRLHADEAVIFVTVVNDFMNSSSELNPAWWNPARYIYYRIGDGRVELDPRSQPAVYRLRQEMELTHRGLGLNLARTIRSYILLEKSLKNPLDRWRQTRNLRAQQPASGEIELPMGGQRGLFVRPITPEVQKGVDIGLGVLRLCRDYARSQGMTLRIVTIPSFPLKFYELYESRPDPAWSLRFGKYDFSQPERLVMDFAEKEGIPALSLGQYIKARGLSAREIKPLFFFGFGHFTPAGHRFVAEALQESFFVPPGRSQKVL